MFKIAEIIERQKNNYDGYNFPKGKYKIIVSTDSFPGQYLKKDVDLEIAEEQWLEWLNDNKRKKRESNFWFYIEHLEANSDLNRIWLPLEILEDAFIKK